MKRAMFKMGRRSIVTSQTAEDAFTVRIEPEWFRKNRRGRVEGRSRSKKSNWTRTRAANGTTVEITQLREGIAKTFAKRKFVDDLIAKVSQNYSYIMTLGLFDTYQWQASKTARTSTSN